MSRGDAIRGNGAVCVCVSVSLSVCVSVSVRQGRGREGGRREERGEKYGEREREENNINHQIKIKRVCMFLLLLSAAMRGVFAVTKTRLFLPALPEVGVARSLGGVRTDLGLMAPPTCPGVFSSGDTCTHTYIEFTAIVVYTYTYTDAMHSLHKKEWYHTIRFSICRY